MSALDDYKLLCRAAFLQRQNARILLWMVGIAIALAFLGTSAAFVYRQGWSGLLVGAGVALAVLEASFILHLVPGFVLMNTPANARLVPRMRRRMVELMVSGWIVAGLGALLLPVWYMAPIVVLYAMCFTAARGGSMAATYLVGFSGMPMSWVWAPVKAFLTTAPGFAAACLALALFGILVLRRVLPDGGDAHFGMRAQRVDAIARISMGSRDVNAAGWQRGNLYGNLLLQAIRSGRPGGLLMAGLGPASHWVAGLPMCVVLFIFGIILHLVLPTERAVVAWVFALSLAWITQLAFCGSLVRLFADGRKEGGLLRLAAICPSSQELNRTMGKEMVRSVLALCGVTLAVTGAVALLDGANLEELVSMVAIASVPVVPGIAWILRDYSSERRTLSALFGYVVLLPAAFIAILVLVALLGLQMAYGAWAWVLLAACSNGVGAIVALRRWNTMMAAPPVFPAYRMG